MAVTARFASVVMIKFTGSPPFDVDGAVSLAQPGRAVNIGDLPQGRSSRTASSQLRLPTERRSSLLPMKHPVSPAAR